MPDRLATILADRYRIERELGQGGMATVYRAHDLKHDRQVAIKVLREDEALTPGAERFLREIRLAAKLTHPQARAAAEYIGPVLRAIVAAAIGERETAITLGRDAFARRDPMLIVFGPRGKWSDGLRELPEFRQILAGMNLPGGKAPPAI